MLAEILVKALIGISTCATQCGCCSMHKRIAESALKEFKEEQPATKPRRKPAKKSSQPLS